MDVQFRMSEALCVLAIYSAAAIPGLTLGCLLANLVTSATVMPLDLIFGTLATLAACSAMWALRKVRVFRRRWQHLPAMLEQPRSHARRVHLLPSREARC